ncbi:MAG: hypothetical protein IJI20_02765 [Firmicutes bacterium]|nr:hypothetical protein [Bacillota bacterium]
MKRFFLLTAALCLVLTLILAGCTTGEVDRYKELQSAMKSNDMELSAAFLESASSFADVSAFLKIWAANADLEVSSDKEHYIVIKNPATDGWKDKPTTTLQCHVDPAHIRQDLDLLSLSMACLLGPLEHGKITLMVTEDDEEDLFGGAKTVKKKSLKKKHLIHLELDDSAMVYTLGAVAATGHMSCKAGRTEPEYTEAYRITMTIPRHADPFTFDKEKSNPNPVETIGNLLASNKSAGRLFEIASFTSEVEKGFLPHEASAVIVLDENNVESFTKKFESSFEGIEKKYKDKEKKKKKNGPEDPDEEEEPLFTYTMEPVEMPEKVLKQKASDNIVSLMYTLHPGINEQDEETGEIMAVSYISGISTADERFTLDVKMRSKTEDALQNLSGTNQVISGLCDVKYKESEPKRVWSSDPEGHLADFFFRAVDAEKDTTPVLLARSEADVLGKRGSDLDMIYYRVNKDHRNKAIKNILAFTAGEDVPE